MVTGTFYLRPASDISIGHSLYPEDFTSAYLLINEETSDGDSTYIYDSHDITASSNGICTSSFYLDDNTDVPLKDISSITNVSLYLNCRTTDFDLKGTVDVIVTFDDTEFTSSMSISGETTYKPYEITFVNIADSIYNYITTNNNLPQITLTIDTNLRGAASKVSSTETFRITQIYLAVEYEAIWNVYTKNNEEWVDVIGAYKKVGNTWFEITKDECKPLLSSFV